MKKRVYYLILLEVVIVLSLTIAWEFWFEDLAYSFLLVDHETEDLVERLEYVVTSFVFVLIALIVPLWIIIKGVSKLEQTQAELQEALGNIKTLRGLVPICANCKMIRSNDGCWQQLEVYITNHSEAKLSHSICPDCVTKLYPDLCS
jgi:hypothetical protein